jgi:hypothetical protein
MEKLRLPNFCQIAYYFGKNLVSAVFALKNSKTFFNFSGRLSQRIRRKQP